MFASSNGRIEIVKLLLEQEGIDINAKTLSGDTALIWASKKGHIEIVNLLRVKGAVQNFNSGNFNEPATKSNTLSLSEVNNILFLGEMLNSKNLNFEDKIQTNNSNEKYVSNFIKKKNISTQTDKINHSPRKTLKLPYSQNTLWINLP